MQVPIKSDYDQKLENYIGLAEIDDEKMKEVDVVTLDFGGECKKGDDGKFKLTAIVIRQIKKT